MSVFLFPGQASQKPGMGLDFFEQSGAARQVFELAAEAAPAGFLDSFFHGEAEAVADTRVAQPGLLTVEVAIAAHLKSKGIQPAACAGHSLGEFSALVIAGALPFQETLALVFERARLMSEEVLEGSMAAVMGMDPESIESLLVPGVQVANYNGPSQTIISGSTAELAAAIAALKEGGAKRVLPLKVSGAFHSECMRPAAGLFAALIEKTAFSAPEIRFVSSVSGHAEDDPARIQALLVSQLVSPVRWTDVMARVDAGPVYEAGPGRVLKGLAKRVEGFPELVSVGTFDEAESLG